METFSRNWTSYWGYWREKKKKKWPHVFMMLIDFWGHLLSHNEKWMTLEKNLQEVDAQLLLFFDCITNYHKT